MAHGSKAKRELCAVAEKFGLLPAGTNPAGHYLWLHKPSGRVIASSSHTGNWRTLKNTERKFKLKIKQIEEETRCQTSS